MSATDQLIGVMDDFSKNGEATSIVIIWANTQGEVVIQTQDALPQVLGLLEFAKQRIIARQFHRVD